MKVLKLLATGLLGSLFCLLLTSTAHAGPVLDAIYKRDAVRCGVSSGVAGFSALGADGQWRGLDVAVCRAVAAAAQLGEPRAREVGRVAVAGGVGPRARRPGRRGRLAVRFGAGRAS